MAEFDNLILEDCYTSLSKEARQDIDVMKEMIIGNFDKHYEGKLFLKDAAELIIVLVRSGLIKCTGSDLRLEKEKRKWHQSVSSTRMKHIPTEIGTTLILYGKIPNGSTPPVTFKGKSYRFVDESILRQRLIGRKPKA